MQRQNQASRERGQHGRSDASGIDSGAGLDVFDREPLPAGHPLLRLDNTVLTPHLGYVTRETYDIYYPQALEDIFGYLRGAPLRELAG